MARESTTYIKQPISKALGYMAAVAQTVKIVMLMPNPADFVLDVVSRVVLLVTKIQKIMDDLNKLLDTYANMPAEAFNLIGQLDNLAGSLTGVISDVQNYVDDANGLTNDIMDTTSNLLDTAESIVKTSQDTYNSMKSTAENTKETVDLEGIEDVKDDPEVKAALNEAFGTDGTDSSNGFDNALNNLGNAKDAVNNAKNKAQGGFDKVNGGLDTATNAINNSVQKVKDIIAKLKENMDKMYAQMDEDFGEMTGANKASDAVSNFTNDARTVSDKTGTMTNNPASKFVSQGAALMANGSEALAQLAKSFKISKVVKAFVGFAEMSLIMELGLDELPPLDVKALIKFSQPQMPVSMAMNWTKMENEVNNSAEVEEVKDMLLELEKQYANMEPSKEYLKQKKKLEKELEAQRRKLMEEKLRVARKEHFADVKAQMADAKSKLNQEREERKKQKSNAKELRQQMRDARTAKMTNNMKGQLKQQFINIKNECTKFGNDIKNEWDLMMQQYTDAANEIKSFFTGEECEGQRYVDQKCDSIDRHCINIVNNCKGIAVQLTSCVAEIPCPTSIGLAFDFPLYKILCFFEQLKVIIKFIKELISDVMGIITDIKDIIHIMLNGINSILDLLKKLMEMFNIKKYIDLVQAIIDMFSSKVLEGKAAIENMISPLYYKDTDEYTETMEAITRVISGESSDEEKESVMYRLNGNILGGSSVVGGSSYSLDASIVDDNGKIKNISTYKDGKDEKDLKYSVDVLTAMSEKYQSTIKDRLITEYTEQFKQDNISGIKSDYNKGSKKYVYKYNGKTYSNYSDAKSQAEADAVKSAESKAISEAETEASNAAQSAQEIFEKLIDSYESHGDDIVAYFSTILSDDGEEVRAYVYYYANLDHLYISELGKDTSKWTNYSDKYNTTDSKSSFIIKIINFIIAKMSKKIMKRACDTGNKSNGGVNMLLDKERSKVRFTGAAALGTLNITEKIMTKDLDTNLWKTGTRYLKTDGNGLFGTYKNETTAFDAYYWYTKWTTDINDYMPDFDRRGDSSNVQITPTIQTTKGSLVNITLEGENGQPGEEVQVFVNDTVSVGDWINVNGKRYRVKG